MNMYIFNISLDKQINTILQLYYK